MSGLWMPATVSGDLFEPDKIQDWARTLIDERTRNFFADEPRFQCLPSGPAAYVASRAGSGLRRIVQNPGVIAILNADLTYRQIFLDGRELEADPFPSWMGYAVGRWDGDTLVVESNGYNDKTWLHREGLSHTASLRITERYRRVDFGHIQLDLTYEDPGTFDSPVQASIVMEFMADSELLETVCNEASEGRSHWGGEITEAEGRVVEVPEEILAKYVGTYEGVWLGAATIAEVTLEDGDLFLERTPTYAENGVTEVGKSMLLAQSENAFECSCGLGFVFTAEGDAMASEVLEVHVSGAWSFKRVQ
jgi:hypothetical protein